MIKDHYNISSNFRPKKSAYNSNVEDFFKGFEDFYTKVLMKKTPDLPHKICDPYGFSMLCEDYKPVFGSIEHDGNPSCHDAFLNVWETPYDSLYKFKFPFKILLDLLYRGYYFSYDLAMSIYNMQKKMLQKQTIRLSLLDLQKQKSLHLKAQLKKNIVLLYFYFP